MSDFDRIPPEIFKFWKSLETEKLKLLCFAPSEAHKTCSYILAPALNFAPIIAVNPNMVLAFGDEDNIIYYWNYYGPDRMQFSEQEFIKLIKLKAFI